MPVPLAFQQPAHVAAEVLREHFGRAVRDREQGAITARENVGRLAEVLHLQHAVLLPVRQLRVLGRKDHLVVDLMDELSNHAFQHAEIQDEHALGVHAALDRDADPVIVTVEGLALMPTEGDEMRGGEDQVVLAHFDAELTSHEPPLPMGSNRPPR